MDQGKAPRPGPAIAQAAVALVLLMGMPFIYTPSSQTDLGAMVFVALVLLAFLIESVLRFVRSKGRGSFQDSIMPPPEK